MDAKDLIEFYVDDVTRRLPRAMRDDVALELRALLNEELQARAAGRAPDEAMALDLLRAFGRPEVVAARYHPAFAIVDPADTRSFLIAAVVGVVALVAVGAPFAALDPPGRDWASQVVLSWLGLLVLYFGVKSWSQRRWPSLARWRPRDPNRASRAGSLALVAVIALGIVCYGAPEWVFGRLSGLKLSTWLAYADDFRRLRLPWLLGVWAAAGALYLVVAAQGRWRPLTRWADIAFGLAQAGLLTWFLAAGDMFRTPVVDTYAKAGVSAALAIVVIDVIAKLWRVRTRLRTPPMVGRAAAA